MASSLAFAALLLMPFPAGAAELDGVQLEDEVRVDGHRLLLNGAGVRTRYFFKVYVAGLYLAQRTASADAALAAAGAKRIVMVMRRAASADQFCQSVDAGLRANNGEAQLAAVRPQTEALYRMIRARGAAHEGMKIVLDYAPSARATTVYADGRALGPPVAGEAFFRALLRIWLGERPVQADLKERLLGRRETAAN
jgi:long-chain acyl-CoA synthetase